jgi:lysine 2,3-aminomutase
MVGLIEKHNTSDPIAKQIVPSSSELIQKDNEFGDPIGDGEHSPVEGIVHRYPDRVLFKVNSACAVYCRFCFRREMIGPGKNQLDKKALSNALNYIKEHKKIWEVILTGGDPLIMSPAKMQMLVNQINEINHVKILRVHTRVPIAAPHLINKDMINALSSSKKTLYISIHINHAREISEETAKICKLLTDNRISLVAQTVLLKGVNDDVSILESLFRKMVENRILPYYLHHPDLAKGTSHFSVPISHGQKLMKELRGSVSGLALPNYMLDIPGGYGKVPITPNYITHNTQNTLVVEDVHGIKHEYPPKSI